MGFLFGVQKSMTYPPTEWIRESELPPIGRQCPKCAQGFLEKHHFTSKTGKEYSGVRCNSCKANWLITHFEDKQPSGKPLSEKEAKTATNFEAVSIRLDKLADYLKGEFHELGWKINTIYEAFTSADAKKQAEKILEDESDKNL